MSKETIRLSKWADRNGLSRMSAWRRAVAGKIEGARLNALDRWVVDVDNPEPERQTVAYIRVSSHDQKADLDRQVARIAEWAASEGRVVHRYVREIGSGLNDRRKELNALLADPLVGTIVVEHRDRLARFGVGHLVQVLASAQRSLVIVDSQEIDDDLVRDVIDVMTCFSARLYGRHSAKNRARKAVAILRDPPIESVPDTDDSPGSPQHIRQAVPA